MGSEIIKKVNRRKDPLVSGWRGRGKGTVGLQYRNWGGGLATCVHRPPRAVRDVAVTCLLASGAPATAEVLVENSLFENCQRGIAFLNINDYNWTIDGEIVQPDSLFRIASISKPITSAAIMLLAQKGKLKLWEKIVDILEPQPYNDTRKTVA